MTSLHFIQKKILNHRSCKYVTKEYNKIDSFVLSQKVFSNTNKLIYLKELLIMKMARMETLSYGFLPIVYLVQSLLQLRNARKRKRLIRKMHL